MKQSIRLCSMESCGSLIGSHGAKGLCPKHYRESMPACTIAGCTKRQFAKRMCSMHYYRAKTSGDPQCTVSGRVDRPPGLCEVEGCGQARRKFEWCASHYAQHYSTGKVHPFAYKWGEGGYAPTHKAIYAARGRAAEYKCCDCGGDAQEWSYSGGCPNEITDARGVRFSRDVAMYEPRCIRCHRIFDDWREKIST